MYATKRGTKILVASEGVCHRLMIEIKGRKGRQRVKGMNIGRNGQKR